MAEPPSLPDVKATLNCVLPDVMELIVGALGIVAGIAKHGKVYTFSVSFWVLI